MNVEWCKFQINKRKWNNSLINLCLSWMNFSFCASCVCLHFCFCFFFCILLCRHLFRVCLCCWILWVFSLKLSNQLRSEQSLAKWPYLPQLKHPFGLSPKSLLGPLSPPLKPLSLSLPPLNPPRAPPLLTNSLFPLLREGSTLIYLPSMTFLFILNYLMFKSKRESAEMRVNTISTVSKYIVRVNSLVSILGILVFDEGVGESVLLLKADTFDGSVFLELFPEVIFGKLNQQHLLQRHSS